MDTSISAITARGLRKAFGANLVLRDVDLDVAVGTVFALLGPNGAGKSTIVRILTTLTRPDAGSASVAGFDLAAQTHELRRAISLTGQAVAVDELQTGTETLYMIGRLWGLSRRDARARAAELLGAFGIADAGPRRVRTYSGGMRRRLDLAASLVAEPAVIFLDEPTNGLDLQSRQTMWQVIEDLAQRGMTVFLTTQYLEEADRLADRVAVIHGGTIVAQGTPAELKRRVGNERLRVTFADHATYLEGLQLLQSRHAICDDLHSSFEVETDGTARDARNLLALVDPGSGNIVHFDLRRPTLDDVFLALTSSDAKTLGPERP